MWQIVRANTCSRIFDSNGYERAAQAIKLWFAG